MAEMETGGRAGSRPPIDRAPSTNSGGHMQYSLRAYQPKPNNPTPINQSTSLCLIDQRSLDSLEEKYPEMVG